MAIVVNFARSARRELERLPARVVRRVMEAIRSLPGRWPPPQKARKLLGGDFAYGICLGQYSLVFEAYLETDEFGREQDLLYLITRVRHRKEAYQ